MQTMFTFSEYKDGGYQFVPHLLEVCVTHLASGDDTDSATFYVAVLEKAELQEKRALIVSTVKGFDTHSVHVQNIEVLLRNKYNYSEVLQMTSAPKEPWWARAQLAPPLETAVLALKPWLPPEAAKRIRFR